MFTKIPLNDSNDLYACLTSVPYSKNAGMSDQFQVVESQGVPTSLMEGQFEDLFYFLIYPIPGLLSVIFITFLV